MGELPGYKDDTSDDDANFDQTSQKDEIWSSKKAKNELNNKRKIHTMSDSDNDDSPDSNDDLKTESGNNSQDILNMSPTLL